MKWNCFMRLSNQSYAFCGKCFTFCQITSLSGCDEVFMKKLIVKLACIGEVSMYVKSWICNRKVIRAQVSVMPTISQKEQNIKSSPRYEVPLTCAKMRSNGCDVGKISNTYFLSSHQVANNRHALKLHLRFKMGIIL